MSNQNKTIRIRCNPRDAKNLNIDLKASQDFEKIDILSLSLKQSDLYRTFNSPVGILMGRASSNGTGLPNIKVSVFLPISEVDQNNPEILAIYPFKNPQDVNPNNNKRYSLLSKLKRLNPFSKWPENNYGLGYTPKTPCGIFPDKPELISNDVWIEVYEKYYKFTTTTNQSGDYCILGIPIGQVIVHAEMDCTDIGKFSSSIPILAQVNGLGSDLFNNSGTKLKDDNLDNPNIQVQNLSKQIIPLWGDDTYSTIGISRQDFDFKTKLTPYFTVMGAGITQGRESSWLDRVFFRATIAFKNLCFSVGNCSGVSDAPGVTFLFGISLNIRAFGKQIVKVTAGSTLGCDTSKTLSICFCFKLVISNVLPMFCVDSIGISRCTIAGEAFDQPPFSIRYLGGIGVCDCTCGTISTCGAEALEDEFTEQLNLASHRVGPINEKVFSYKPSVSDNDIYSFNTDVREDIMVLQPNEFAKIESPNGTFLYQIPCNRNRVITDEFGNEIQTADPAAGLPTAFNGYIIFSMGDLDISNAGNKLGVDRVRIKVPACSDYNDNWIQSSYNFEANNLYSVAQLISVANQSQPEKMTGLITEVNTLNQTNDDLYGQDMEMIENNTMNLFGKPNRIFKQEWLNGTLYFLQAGFKNKRGKKKDIACGLIVGNNTVRTRHNSEPLGGSVIDNYFILNNETYQTNFINLDKNRFINVIAPSTYRGIKFNTDPSKFLMNDGNSGIKYYYRGLLDDADATNNLIDKDVI